MSDQTTDEIIQHIQGSEDEYENDGEQDIEDSDQDIEDSDQDIEDSDQDINKEKINKSVLYQSASSSESSEESEDDSDDDLNEEYRRIEKESQINTLLEYHPETEHMNYKEIIVNTTIKKDKNGNIIDGLHKTTPILTKFEKARILGLRAKQLNNGSTAFIDVPTNIIDGRTIAELELKEKKIPFIIRRPMPNGGSEYWKLQDLEIL